MKESTKEVNKDQALLKEAEEFACHSLVGDCPRCGGHNTKDCETIVDIEDATVGVCLDCGYLWCLECGFELKEEECPHWAVCDKCDHQGEYWQEDASECSLVQDFMNEK